MKRVIGSVAFAVVVAVVTASALRATLAPPDDPVGAAVEEQPTLTGRSVAPHREVATRSDHAASAVARTRARPEPPPRRPDWATDDLRQLSFVAPSPDELPCGTTDCLQSEPRRHRREMRRRLADGALSDLMEAQAVPAHLEEELMAQLAANLEALE